MTREAVGNAPVSREKARPERVCGGASAAVLKGLVYAAAILTFAVLLFLIGYILVTGIPHLTPSLFSLHYTSENVSMLPAIVTTVEMTALALLLAVPLGLFTAIYLNEYAKRGNKLVGVIRVTTETLSGIPSIVYGLFGMLFFVTQLHWGYSLIAGAMTLAIMILPLIMRTAEEALMSVPDSFREGSFGLGDAVADAVAVHAECGGGGFPAAVVGQPGAQGVEQVGVAVPVEVEQRAEGAGGEVGGGFGRDEVAEGGCGVGDDGFAGGAGALEQSAQLVDGGGQLVGFGGGADGGGPAGGVELVEGVRVGCAGGDGGAGRGSPGLPGPAGGGPAGRGQRRGLSAAKRADGGAGPAAVRIHRGKMTGLLSKVCNFPLYKEDRVRYNRHSPLGDTLSRLCPRACRPGKRGALPEKQARPVP